MTARRPDGYLTPGGHSLASIVAEVSRACDIRAEDIFATSRQPHIVFARVVAMVTCRELLGLSYPAIGDEFGFDGSTVMFHHRNAARSERTTEAVRLVIEQLALDAAPAPRLFAVADEAAS